MAEFINTVDIIGDDALIDSIIYRSVTECNDNTIRSIGHSAFNACSKLTSVSFPAVTSIGEYAFAECSALTSVDFPLATSLSNYTFSNCSALTAIILRNTSVCTLSSVSAFNSTPIKSGTCYIYVPAAIVDSYKAATNWSTYATQFRALEDYTVDGTTTGELDPTKI